MIKRIIISFLIANVWIPSHAQKDAVSEEINITKEREVTIQKANKILNKGTILTSPKGDNSKIVYTFFERKPSGANDLKFDPTVIDPVKNKKDAKEDMQAFQNYIKVGLGNYGRIYAEGHLNSAQDKSVVYGISGFHNSTKRGPINDVISGTGNSKFLMDGKYYKKNFEIKGEAGFERRLYYFYGYDTLANSDYTKDDLRQRLNLFNFKASFENTNPKPNVDYSLSTGIKFLDDNYDASELEWGTRFNAFFPLSGQKVVATIASEAYITELSDDYKTDPSGTLKRNFFRVEPGFTFNFGRFGAKVGFKAVNEYDQISKINNTKGFPTAVLSYKTPSLTYFFIGYDGDIIRNTLHSILEENPFIVEQVNLQNTYKNNDYYIGVRGELYSGLSFNTKISYGKYQNMYYYDVYEGQTTKPNDPFEKPIKTTKFQLEYEEKDAKTDFVNVSADFSYNNLSSWKSNLRLEYNYFETLRFNKAYHRPAFTAKWGNNFSLNNKLVASLDAYYLNGLYARNIELGEAIKLKDIVDLNAEITYLFTKQFSTFVKLNNIVGQNYQRYYFYPRLGLNFVAGVNLSL